MNDLRTHCPWDKVQTKESLRRLTIEEAYELSSAIVADDWEEVKKELGDLLLHIVFYAKIASESQGFGIEEVITQLCEKLVRRHPHIYAEVEAGDEGQVRQRWEALKLKEGNRSVLSGVPEALPALVKAFRLQEKARGVGFDWDTPEQVWAKVEEEAREFAEVRHDPDQAEAEMGDWLFALINYARFANIDPEAALERTNQKFIRRFQYLETQAQALGKQLPDMTLAEMDVFWNEAKAKGL
jgi:XTP/dITP diphosphohydrolase